MVVRVSRNVLKEIPEPFPELGNKTVSGNKKLAFTHQDRWKELVIPTNLTLQKFKKGPQLVFNPVKFHGNCSEIFFTTFCPS